MNINLSIKSLIFALNLREWDPIHSVRIISNFYSKNKNNKLTYNETEQLITKMVELSNCVKNDFHRNIYQLLIYILSGYNEKYKPNVFNPIINYTISDRNLDERLIEFNILVDKNEFK